MTYVKAISLNASQVAQYEQGNDAAEIKPASKATLARYPYA
jgi:hypothetical protein